ncbi:MAG: GNAT family N-acetyltransferase [Chloroflexi bacterium]|nr:GNAT family N-acetyltransferase [Chloroflexota bacterium]
MSTFVPASFVVPLRVEHPNFVLRPLTVDDVEHDYDAVMSSVESLRHVFAAQDDWPADDMTIEDNYRDLARHQQDFERRAGFTYTVETPDGARCLGCVYIYPTGRGDYQARVHYWVRDSDNARGLDVALGATLRRWLAEAWPFERVAFPGREIPWAEWAALAAASESRKV